MTASAPRPPVRRTGETTLVTVMFFAAGIVFLDRFGITYLFPEIAPELHLDNRQLGSLVSVTAVAWAISSLVFSVLSDRIGRRKPIILASLVLFSIAVALVGLAHSYGVMLALRAVIGFCEGPAVPIIQSIVARSSTPERRGRNLGIVIAGTAVIGGALAPSIMVGLSAAVGWRATFPIVAVPGLVVAALVALLYQENRSDASGESVRLRDFRTVIANRNVLLAVIGTIVMIGYTIGFGAFAPQFLAERNFSRGASTLVLTVFGVVGAVGNIVAPLLSDRIGRKPALLLAAICAGLVPLFFVLFAGSIPLLLVSLVVGVIGGGALTINTYVVPAESVPRELIATAFALQIAVGETIGGALGPQLGGAIADATHNLGNAMLLYAAAPIVLVIVALLIKETAPRRTRVTALETIGAGTETVVP